MIKNLGWEAWCDQCGAAFGTIFASQFETRKDLVEAMRKEGWSIGKLANYCDHCREEAR